jgi:fructosamine-3-kinase
MSMQDTDVSWQILRHIVHDWAGSQVELDEVRPLEGGYVATTLALRAKSGERAVLKITPHRIDRAYADEACQLKVLGEAGLPVPEVYRCEVGSLDRPFSYLLMEFREGVDLAHAKAACTSEQYDALQGELAEIVQRMHAQTHESFCRLTAGELKTFDTWPLLYREMFDPIWHEAEKNGHLPPKCRKLVAKIHERLPTLLHQDDSPRLLHGDLWSSNVLAQQDAAGNWHVSAILDPHCRYGHIEVELAYMELFHTVNSAFMRAYQGESRLPSEYHTLRKPVYQLYELLNHLQLYGHEYLKPTVEAIERAARVT